MFESEIPDSSQSTWSPTLVTLLSAFLWFLGLFTIFLSKRSKYRRKNKFKIYETRQYTRGHRSPKAFDGGTRNPLGWAIAAYRISNDELLRCVGLDSYVCLRFLRLGFRVASFGSILGCVVLIPIYYKSGKGTPDSREFNAITLSNVSAKSHSLWASVICWYAFVAFVLYELVTEWNHYSEKRYEFLARGDVDSEKGSRYTIMVENLPLELQSNQRLKRYFERIFPGKVREVCVCLDTDSLDILVRKRESLLKWYEVAEAQIIQERSSSACSPSCDLGGCCARQVADLESTLREIDATNAEIDARRQALLSFADEVTARDRASSERDAALLDSTGEGIIAGLPGGPPERMVLKFSSGLGRDRRRKRNLSGHRQVRTVADSSASARDSPLDEQSQELETSFEQPLLCEADRGLPQRYQEVEDVDGTGAPRAASTAFVTFTSLRTTQAATQCHINSQVDHIDVVPAAEPQGIIWNNVTVPGWKKRMSRIEARVLWTVGILFWAIPVTFVTSLANLDSILNAFDIKIDNKSFLYGLAAGLLPVLALWLPITAVPFVLETTAIHLVRLKSQAAVEAEVFRWHQFFQLANLFYIVVGGSLFSQINSLVNGGAAGVLSSVAKAITESSVFLVHTTIWFTFSRLGQELSMFTTYGMKLLRQLFLAESRLTQRMLDDAKKTRSAKWGFELPWMFFVFVVGLVYMPIVPIVELFAALFFGGAYIVWKHQCLHVYAQESEGGGVIWVDISMAIVTCLYVSELVFIGMMLIKEGEVQFILGFVPLVGTIILERELRWRMIRPLESLALELAATIDLHEGELEVLDKASERYDTMIESMLYGQPVLKASLDERSPMPYRRTENASCCLKNDIDVGNSEEVGDNDEQQAIPGVF